MLLREFSDIFACESVLVSSTTFSLFDSNFGRLLEIRARPLSAAAFLSYHSSYRNLDCAGITQQLEWGLILAPRLESQSFSFGNNI